MTADQYRIKASRGPRLELDPHQDSCDLKDISEYAKKSDRPLAVDLFCCGGGLSLGLEEAGFGVILGVDIDDYAVETHRAHFGGVSLRADLSDSDEISSILDALEGVDVSLVAGSPPCQPFSRAGSSKIRSLVQKGVRSEEDGRRDLWKGFLGIVKRLKPPTVLMENVPDLVSGDNSIVFRKIVEALENIGYDVYTRVLPSWQYGVPQHRQRVFIVGVQSGTPFSWPKPSRKDKPGVEEAISDLPAITAGEVNGGLPYGRKGKSTTALQRWFRKGQPQRRGGRVYDHFARSVRKDDLQAFRLMKSNTRYSDLPAHLRRYTTDHFDDKYKRLGPNEPSRTITAHIARDGYWYIHPTDHRTLTMREAARIQTFPDRFRFAGTPSHAFRQIGEAVPPLVARAIGRSLIRSLGHDKGSSHPIRTTEVSEALAQWIHQKTESELRAPWRVSQELWQILMGMVLFGRKSAREAASAWPHYKALWPDSTTYLSDRNRKSSLDSDSGKHCEILDGIAKTLANSDPNEPPAQGCPTTLSAERWKAALALAGKSDDLRPTTSTRRLVARAFGNANPESHMTAQIAIARLVGVRDTSMAYSAVLEIGDKYCRPKKPICEKCPIKSFCVFYQNQSLEKTNILLQVGNQEPRLLARKTTEQL